MIINDKDAASRLNSPLNLINRIAESKKNNSKNQAMSLFGIGRKKEEVNADSPASATIRLPEEIKAREVAFNPFIKPSVTAPVVPPQTPVLENLLTNQDSQIKLGLAHDNALKLLNSSVELLATKLDDITPSKLPAVVTAAAKVVEGIRRERNEAAKNSKGEREVHYHFYTPQQNKISDYEVIDVTPAG